MVSKSTSLVFWPVHPDSLLELSSGQNTDAKFLKLFEGKATSIFLQENEEKSQLWQKMRENHIKVLKEKHKVQFFPV